MVHFFLFLNKCPYSSIYPWVSKFSLGHFWGDKLVHSFKEDRLKLYPHIIKVNKILWHTVHAAKCYDQSHLRTWNFESHVTFLHGFCVDITRKYREFCVKRGDRTWNSVIASVEKINSKREKDYLQNYFTCVNEYCVAIRVLQCFQEGSNFPLKCEMRGNSFH